jgi:DNA repair protein RadC
MSDHLIAITDLARQIRHSNPSMKWTDAVKMASMQMSGGSIGGRKKKAVIYVRPRKTKSGKTRYGVYARPNTSRKKSSTKMSNKYTPQTYEQFMNAQKLPVDRNFKPLPKSKAKPKPKPFKEVFAPVKVTKTNVFPKTMVMPKAKPVKATKPKKEKGVYRMPYGGNYEDYPMLTNQQFRDKWETVLFTNDEKEAIKGYNKGLQVFGRPKGKKYAGYYFFINTPDLMEKLMYTRYMDGRALLSNEHPLWEGYMTAKPIKTAGKTMSKKVAGLTYSKGKPMLSLSGYRTTPEQIFIGANSTVCGKVKMLNRKPKNIGELTEVYAIPEIRVEVVGTKVVKDSPKIRNSANAVTIIRNYIDAKYIGLRATKEVFGLLCCNYQNQVMGVYIMSIGSRNAVVVDMGYILSVLAKISPKSIFLFHNHPSGNMQASKPDIDLTRNIKTGICNPLDIQLMDHIILSGPDDDYYSLADNGEI